MVLGILGSGSGSNMQAILDAMDAGVLVARIALVLSDNPDAFILKRARRHGITTGLIDCRGFKTKFPAAAQEETAARLQAAGNKTSSKKTDRRRMAQGVGFQVSPAIPVCQRTSGWVLSPLPHPR